MGMTFAGFPALNPGERQIPFEVQQSPIVEGLGLLEHSQSNSDESVKQAMTRVGLREGGKRWKDGDDIF